MAIFALKNVMTKEEFSPSPLLSPSFLPLSPSLPLLPSYRLLTNVTLTKSIFDKCVVWLNCMAFDMFPMILNWIWMAFLVNNLLLRHEFAGFLQGQSGAVRSLKEVTIGCLVAAGCVRIWCPEMINVWKSVFKRTWRVRSFVLSFIRSVVRLFCRLFLLSFVPSFCFSFILSFVHSSVRSFWR